MAVVELRVRQVAELVFGPEDSDARPFRSLDPLPCRGDVSPFYDNPPGNARAG